MAKAQKMERNTNGRDVAVLFGDGAGAVIVSSCDVTDSRKDSHILSSHIHTQGEFAKELWIEAPGSAIGGDDRISIKALEEKKQYPYMNGRKVYVNAIKRMCEAIHECLKHNNVELEEVDLFLFHQANMRINEAVGEKLGLDTNKIFNTIDRFGNTTAATIPLGMDEAVKAGVLKKGMLVATAAFGSGFTWGSTLLRY